MIPGRATPEGTAAYAKKIASAHPGHWRPALGVTLSSLGMGTYLGNADPVTDGRYAAAALKALELGINVIDSAVNYRYQRSERSIGEALRKAIAGEIAAREEVLLCTKGGFIAGDTEPPSERWWEETFVKPGIARVEDVVAGCHCMTPAYLKHQLEQSRRNLGVETIDVYHVHNPEIQLGEVGEEEFYRRLTAAFRALEEAAAEGKIGVYGTATWDGYRVPPAAPSYLSLDKVIACAREAGGEGHRFRAIQLPFSLGMAEAHLAPSQRDGRPALEVARELGLTVFTSASLLQARLLGRLGPGVRPKFPGLKTDAQRCLQFARSTPGVTVPLCGMKDVEHVEENARVAAVAPFTPEEFATLFPRG